MKILINTLTSHSHSDIAKPLCIAARDYMEAMREDHVSVMIPDNAELLEDAFTRLTIERVRARSSPLLRNYRLDKKFAAIIAKEQPDVLLSPVLLRTTSVVKQILLPSFYMKPYMQSGGIPDDKQAAKLKKYIEGAHCTIVFSEAEQAFLLKLFPGLATPIQVIYRITYTTTTLDYEAREKVKEKIAGGHEYFLCLPSADLLDIKDVLKGFSGFKKWQKSGMKLVLSAVDETERAALRNMLSSYRFKDEVAIKLIHQPDYNKFLSGAYAAIAPGKCATDLRLPFSAVSASVLPILAQESPCAELFAGQAFLFRHGQKDDIARVLLESFRDEKKRNEIIRQAKSIVAGFEPTYFYANIRLAMQGLITKA